MRIIQKVSEWSNNLVSQIRSLKPRASRGLALLIMLLFFLLFLLWFYFIFVLARTYFMFSIKIVVLLTSFKKMLKLVLLYIGPQSLKENFNFLNDIIQLNMKHNQIASYDFIFHPTTPDSRFHGIYQR